MEGGRCFCICRYECKRIEMRGKSCCGAHPCFMCMMPARHDAAGRTRKFSGNEMMSLKRPPLARDNSIVYLGAPNITHCGLTLRDGAGAGVRGTQHEGIVPTPLANTTL